MLHSINKIITPLISIITPLVIPAMLLGFAQNSSASENNKIKNQANQIDNKTRTQEYQQIAKQIEVETLKHRDYAKSLADKIEAQIETQINTNTATDIKNINEIQKSKNTIVPTTALSSQTPISQAPSTKSTNIVEQVLADYGKVKQKSCSDSIQKKSLLIFVSFSMPQNLLKNYDDIARKLGAKLVIRGLKDNSFKETIQYLKNVKTSGIMVDIDPTSFERFNVNLVPSFVLSDGHSYDKLVGSVSIVYALEKFANNGELKIQAKDLLSKLSHYRDLGGVK